MIFQDRVDAGRRLAERLRHLAGQDLVVLGLPRGGVPVGFEVAQALGAPLDVVVVRKLGVPFQPEVAMGAVGEGGVVVRNDEALRMARVGEDELAAAQQREQAEVERRAVRFRAGRPATPVAGRTAIIVDDGVATGSTARAACQVVRALGAAQVVLAVPVAPPDTLRRLSSEADDVVCVHTPAGFGAVGQFYRDFRQTSDDEVVRLLRAAPHGTSSSDAAPLDEEVLVRAGAVSLPGDLASPASPTGVVVFAHGSGSSRHSPRNQAVAAALRERGLATLLLDLLTPDEEGDRAAVFDIALLSARLVAAVAWLRRWTALGSLPVGLFGASTGAAAALWAAADPEAGIAAVVSRGGRPDLAEPRLPAVHAPTLLVVGGRDEVVVGLNRQAAALLRCDNRLVVVPGATHLFEEPGALESVATLAAEWFATHLRATTSGGRTG